MGRTWYSGSWDLWLLKSGSTSSHFIPLLPDIPQAVGEHCQYAQEGCWQGRWHCLGTLATLRTMLGGSSHGSYLGSVSGVSSPTYKCWITQSWMETYDHQDYEKWDDPPSEDPMQGDPAENPGCRVAQASAAAGSLATGLASVAAPVSSQGAARETEMSKQVNNIRFKTWKIWQFHPQSIGDQYPSISINIHQFNRDLTTGKNHGIQWDARLKIWCWAASMQ